MRQLKIATELNERGDIIRVLVYANDKDSAKILNYSANECSPNATNANQTDNTSV